MEVQGKADMKQVLQYIHEKQQTIRKEEDAEALRKQGIDVEIGFARFESATRMSVNGKSFEGRLIFLCTGSSPQALSIPGMNYE